MSQNERWSDEQASAARSLRERVLNGGMTPDGAVQELKKAGEKDAWNLWLDVWEEVYPFKQIPGRVRRPNPDRSKRRSRQLPPVRKEAVMAEANEATTGETIRSTPVRRGRPKKTENNGAVAAPDAAKRQRKSKELLPPVVMDLFLPRGRSVQIAMPGDVSDDDMPIIQDQLNAFMALRAAQRKAQGS